MRAIVLLSGGLDSYTAAAIVKTTPKRAVLDCLWVRPEYHRRGWATALVTDAVNALAADGATVLRSRALLANPESQAWHRAFGFRQLPDLSVASAYMWHYHWEHHRLRDANAPAAEVAAAEAHMNQWREEYERLEVLGRGNYRSVHPCLDD